jgi:hypothetical protein
MHYSEELLTYFVQPEFLKEVFYSFCKVRQLHLALCKPAKDSSHWQRLSLLDFVSTVSVVGVTLQGQQAEAHFTTTFISLFLFINFIHKVISFCRLSMS